MIPIKHAAQFKNGAAFKPSDWGDEGLPILRIAQLTGKPFDNFFQGAIPRFLGISDGDLLFSWSATIDAFIWDRGDAVLNQHIFKVIPKKNADKKYLYYIIKHHAPRWSDNDAHGSTMRHIKKGSLSNKVYLPDLVTQRKIVEFLDRETARIDLLIEKKQRLVDAIKAKISDFAELAVTQGINTLPQMQKTEMPWIDAVPSHWKIVRGKYLFQQMSRQPCDDDGVITAFRDGQVCLRSKRRTEGYTFAELEVGYQHIKKGDLVINTMDAFAGAIGVSEDSGKSTGEYAVCAPIGDHNATYFAYLLRCMAKRDYISVLCPSVRERAPRFRFVRFAPVFLPVPPRDEQDAIVDAIEQMRSGLSTVQTKTTISLDRLKEYRSALITAAVTGQIDVQTYVKSGTPDCRLGAMQEEMDA